MSPDRQERRRIVVDGSNIATEGRTVPSLAQLDEAIRSFLEEYQGFATTDVTVVVDATFGHRIDPSEVAAFDQAVEHGEMITPPAGAVGRGDGFILRIAEKSGALVLSNDSFQEFHAERPWLFEPGRLIGGKPVPGVGWVFTPRTPVRGAKSRSSTSRARRDGAAGGEAADGTEDAAKPLKAAKRTKKAKATASTKATGGAKATKAAKEAEPAKATKATKATKGTKAAKAAKAAEGTTPTKAAKATKATRATKTAKATKAASMSQGDALVPAEADGSAADTPTAAKRTRRKRTGSSRSTGAPSPATAAAEPAATAPPAALNEPVTFLNFVAEHPVGSTFDGTVVAFTSHGAHVDVDGMLCHVPLRRLGDPPPTRARQVLTKGEIRPFVLVSLDVAHRRAEVAVPGLEGG